MELNELVGIDSFILVEESYAAQKWLDRTRDYLGKIENTDFESSIRIHDKDGALIGLALHDRELGFWMLFTDVLADPRLRTEFETLAEGSEVTWKDCPDGVVFNRIAYIAPFNQTDTWLLNISKFKAHIAHDNHHDQKQEASETTRSPFLLS